SAAPGARPQFVGRLAVGAAVRWPFKPGLIGRHTHLRFLERRPRERGQPRAEGGVWGCGAVRVDRRAPVLLRLRELGLCLLRIELRHAPAIMPRRPATRKSSKTQPRRFLLSRRRQRTGGAGYWSCLG